MDISFIEGLISVGLAAMTAGLTAMTITVMRQQNATNRHQVTSVFLDIADRWSKIYPERNRILNSQAVTVQDLQKRYGNDFKKFLDSDEWEKIRPLCNFFEILGFLLDKNYINRDGLFGLVSVDVFIDYRDGAVQKVPQGVLYRKLEGYIGYLRQVYKPNIYNSYDDLLLPAYKKHVHQ